MKKKILRFNLITAFILIICFCFNTNFIGIFADKSTSTVYLGGMPIGLSLNTRGVTIVGLTEIINDNIHFSPSKDAGIKIGDIIENINGSEINSSSDIEEALIDSEIAKIKIKRGNDLFETYVIPKKDINGKSRLGVFVRNNVSGIGTVTYIKDDKFASLGHPIQNENNGIIDILGGEIFLCSITGIIKGEKGKAGELKGVFLRDSIIGNAQKNTACGVYGNLNSEYTSKAKLQEIEVGMNEAKIGGAKIYSTIDGCSPKAYSINIVKVDYNEGSNRNLVLKITDENLINSSGGIVQGMSGSPIVQDGKLIGAITHVFINDPLRGFGITINNMLNN